MTLFPSCASRRLRSVWRWYYWQVDHSSERQSTLEALATRLNTETNPMVRRGLEESIYDLLDENTGYLGSWVRASPQEADKAKIQAGFEAAARDQAQVLAKVFARGHAHGTRRHPERALGDFHIRHYALPPLKATAVTIELPAVLPPNTSLASPICIARGTNIRPTAGGGQFSTTTSTTAFSRRASAMTASDSLLQELGAGA